jgi:uncharacterized protein (TIGR00369 family)
VTGCCGRSGPSGSATRPGSFLSSNARRQSETQHPMENSLDSAREVLRAQPFSILLNAEIISFGSGSVELRIPITAQVKQQHGFVHGGLISYAADNALTFAGGSALGPAVVTSEFKINYLRPAMGEELVVRASVIYAGRNQAVCQCRVSAVSGGEQVLCAVAQGTITSLGQPK